MEGRRVKRRKDMSQCRNQGCRDGYAALYTVKSGAKKHRFFDERKENEWILTESEGLGKNLPAKSGSGLLLFSGSKVSITGSEEKLTEAKVSFGSSSKKWIYRLCQNGISFFHAQENAVAELFALCKHPEGVVTPGKGIDMADQRKNL